MRSPLVGWVDIPFEIPCFRGGILLRREGVSRSSDRPVEMGADLVAVSAFARISGETLISRNLPACFGAHSVAFAQRFADACADSPIQPQLVHFLQMRIKCATQTFAVM